MGILSDVQFVESGVKGLISKSIKNAFPNRISCAANGGINPIPFSNKKDCFGS